MMRSSGETRRENANSCLSTVIANGRALADAGLIFLRSAPMLSVFFDRLAREGMVYRASF